MSPGDEVPGTLELFRPLSAEYLPGRRQASDCSGGAAATADLGDVDLGFRYVPGVPGPLLDLSRADDRHTSERLSTEPVIWLGSTRSDGRPHRAPVWFVWSDPAVLVFSMARTVKLRNIQGMPQVALSLDTADSGRDIVMIDGSAEVLTDDVPATVQELTAPFADKYAPLLPGGSFQDWRQQFSVPVLISVTRVVAWTRKDGELFYRSVP